MECTQQRCQTAPVIPWWRAHGWAVAAFALGTCLWIAAIALTHFQLEDALITFRYAANLAGGHGFVFNAGERVLGTTTPLLTLLLALCALPFGASAIPAISTVLMTACGLLTGVVGYGLLLRFGFPHAQAALGMLLLYAHPMVIRTGIGGMETPLALLLMLLSLWALTGRKPVAAGVYCGLLALCRIDGLLWVALIFGAMCWKSRRDAAVQATVLLAVLLPWIVFVMWYFGSPIPNTVSAKGVIRPGMEGAQFDPDRIVLYLRWFASGTGMPWCWSALPWWLLLAGGAWKLCRAGRDAALLVLFPPLYALALYFGRSPKYAWYLLPITLCALPIVGVGIGQVVGFVGRVTFARLPRARIPVSLLFAGVVAACYFTLVAMPSLRYMVISQANEDGLRRQVGVWLRENTPHDATVAMEAIGYQGYYSERRIIDLAGLVTPRVVEYKRRTAQNGQIFEWIREELRPDYLVLRSFEVDANRHFNGSKLFLTPKAEARFHATYREVLRFTAPYPDNHPLLTRLTVYQRLPQGRSRAESGPSASLSPAVLQNGRKGITMGVRSGAYPDDT